MDLGKNMLCKNIKRGINFTLTLYFTMRTQIKVRGGMDIRRVWKFIQNLIEVGGGKKVPLTQKLFETVRQHH